MDIKAYNKSLNRTLRADARRARYLSRYTLT